MTKPSSHCSLNNGDIIGSDYKIIKELGNGRFATVWMAVNKFGDAFAIKVYRKNTSLIKYYSNEIKIHMNLLSYGTHLNIIKYNDTFTIIRICDKFKPRIYPCIVFNLEGDTLVNLIDHYIDSHNLMPVELVKKIMRQLLNGLQHIHNNDIIHTDIKPDNILINSCVENFNIEDFNIKIGDLGSSTKTNKLFSNTVGTLQYCAPELILELPYDKSIDIWASFITCFELLTGDLLFDIYSETDMIYGDDIKSTELSIDSFDDSSNENELDQFNINYRYFVLLSKILGNPPRSFAKNARKYYNNRNMIINMHIEKISISELLHGVYNFSVDESKAIEHFLEQGLKYNSKDRCTVKEAINHPWLN